MSYYLYILYSEKLDRYYVGSTGDLIESRIKKHNSNHKGYTGKANDWKLKYQESFLLREAAYSREREIKKWKSRKRIEFLIKDNE